MARNPTHATRLRAPGGFLVGGGSIPQEPPWDTRDLGPFRFKVRKHHKCTRFAAGVPPAPCSCVVLDQHVP
jgi:hypothetical protein